MKKLLFKHVSPYMPYKMQFKVFDSPPDVMTGLGFTFNKEPIVYYNFRRSVGRSYLDVIKPLLIPLSEVTKKQWMQVFKAGIDDVVQEVIDQYFKPEIRINKSIIYYYNANKASGFRMPEESLFVINLDPLQFSAGYNLTTKSNSSYRFHQLKAIDEMNLLHIDYMGLIDAGLALNKNDYK